MRLGQSALSRSASRLKTERASRRAAAHGAARGTHPRRVRTATVERQVRAVYRDGMTVGQLQRGAGVSRSAAGKWRKVLCAEAEHKPNAPATPGNTATASAEGRAQ